MLEWDWKEVFDGQYEYLTYLSHYSRWIEEEQRREMWPETVKRYMDFMQVHLKERCDWKMPKELYTELYQAIYTLEVMPSMRCLWTAGDALRADEAAAYNCSFLPVDHPHAFDEAMYLLMVGSGVGFSVEERHISQLPTVSPTLEENTETVIQVADSRIGWAKALRELISLLYNGFEPSWDLSRIRPAGARLKTFGGRASGPEPLESLFVFATNIFRQSRGQRLSSLACHDLMTKVGECVVAGGVRRSAMISLSDLSDYQMRNAKSGNWGDEHAHRRLANNSAVYMEKPSVGQYLREWESLYNSKSGERGMFNLAGVRAREEARGVRDWTRIEGANPCLTYDTPIVTKDGIRLIGEWAEKKLTHQVPHPENDTWISATASHTGKKPIFRMQLSNGAVLRTTANHLIMTQDGFKEMQDIEEGESIQTVNQDNLPTYAHHDNEAVMLGFLQGDGHYHQASNRWKYVFFNEKDEDVKELFQNCLGKEMKQEAGRPQAYNLSWQSSLVQSAQIYLTKATLPERALTPQVVQLHPKLAASFLRGLYSANGSVLTGYRRVTLKSTCHEMVQQVQTMLTLFGIRSYITTNRAREQQFDNGRYPMRESYDLNITSDDILTFQERIGFVQSYKNERLSVECKAQVLKTARRRLPVVVSISPDGEEDVYDFHMEEVHYTSVNGFAVHNCVEINLWAREHCNLTEQILRWNDTPEIIYRKARLATILGTFQSTLTNFRYLSKRWQRNDEEERLLGVSFTGIYDHPIMSDFINPALPGILTQARQIVHRTNQEFAKKLGINTSTAMTCVKPSGTVSQLCNTSSGIHPRYARYYIRRQQLSNYDPITQAMIEAGIPNDPYIDKPDQDTSFAFPVQSPKHCKTVEEVSPIEHLELWKLYQEHWCDHKPSATIYLRERDWLPVAEWVYRHFDSISGLSFYPYDDNDYPQPVYLEMSEGKFNEEKAKMPAEVDFHGLLQKHETDDETQGAREYACVGGACELG